MKHNLALIAMAVAVLGLAACDDKVTTESTETSTVNGTTVESKTTTETTTDNNGNLVNRDVETKTTVDPEGMMNKETVEEKKIEETAE